MRSRLLVPAVLGLALVAWLAAGTAPVPGRRDVPAPAAPPPPAPSLRAASPPAPAPAEPAAPPRKRSGATPSGFVPPSPRPPPRPRWQGPPRVGRVVDPAGRPVAGAGIAFWSEPPPTVYRGHRARQHDRGIRTRTGPEGWFEIPPTRLHGDTVGVRASGFAWAEVPWPDRTVPLEIVLEPEIRLTGRVTDDRGRTVARTWVRVFDERPEAQRLPSLRQRGRLGGRPPGMLPGRDEPLHSTSVTPSGTWTAHVPEGPVRIRLEPQVGTPVETTWFARPDRANHVEIRLPASTCLHARLDPPPGGDGLDYDVQLFEHLPRPGEDPGEGFAFNDGALAPDFAFRLLLPTDGAPWWLVVFLDDHDDLPVHVAGPFHGPHRDLVLALPPDCHRQSRVTGRIAPPPPEEVSWYAVLQDARGFERAEDIESATGAFEIPEVPPGIYRLLVRDDEDRVRREQALEVAPGVPLDVGTLRVAGAVR